MFKAFEVRLCLARHLSASTDSFYIYFCILFRPCWFCMFS